MKSAMPVCALVALASLTALPLAALAGPMTPPPGAPSATMKTLAEVEPRIAINAVNTPGDASSAFRITQPGSYYLAGNLSVASAISGIVIDSSDVTLDLSGFTVTHPTENDGVAAIAIESVPARHKGIVIRNGTVRGGGVAGVYASSAVGVRVEGVTVRDAYNIGIDVSYSGIVTGCVVSDCNTGITAADGTLIENCTMDGNDRGAYLFGGTIRNCVIRGNGGAEAVGVLARDNCLVENNHFSATGVGMDSKGIRIFGSGNRILGNHVSGFASGIYGESGAINNFVVSNTARSTMGAFVFTSSPNAVGPLSWTPGSGFTTSSPYANFAW